MLDRTEYFCKRREVVVPESQSARRIRSGSFSKVEKVTNGTYYAKLFQDCRDAFHEYKKQIERDDGKVVSVLSSTSKNIRRMLYCHERHRGYAVASFMQKVEEKLGVEGDYGPTQRNTIMWVHCPWWTTSSIKRSLFTGLLRAGQAYRPLEDNFEEALKSDIYTGRTIPAIKRFLDGHVKYTGHLSGWDEQFWWNGYQNNPLPGPKPPSVMEIERLLV